MSWLRVRVTPRDPEKKERLIAVQLAGTLLDSKVAYSVSHEKGNVTWFTVEATPMGRKMVKIMQDITPIGTVEFTEGECP